MKMKSKIIIIMSWIFIISLSSCAQPEELESQAPTETKTNTPLPVLTGAGGGIIVFASDRSGNNADLFLVNADGSGLQQLTNTRADEIAPSWSPDGSALAYLESKNGGLRLYILEMTEYVSGLITSEPRQLSTLKVDESIPSWSPDSKYIMVSAETDGNQELFIIPVDGSPEQRLTRTEYDEKDPAWSPDGEGFVYTSNPDGNFDLFYAEFNPGDTLDILSSSQLTMSDDDEMRPDWSPDGLQIVYSNADNGNHNLYLIALDGSAAEQLTDTPAKEWNPRWSIQGNLILYSYFNFSDTLNDLVILDLSDQTEKIVTFDSFDNWWPGWKP
jgi:TolB protein